MKKTTKKKTKRETPGLTRRGLTRITTHETLESLKQKHKATKVTQRGIGKVRLEQLRIADQVFQWRRIGYDLEASTDQCSN